MSGCLYSGPRGGCAFSPSLVSSGGYQKIQGRVTKDPDIPGSKAMEETETPQLQAYCLHKYSAEKEVYFYAPSPSVFFFLFFFFFFFSIKICK